jgi:hypothetical protein
MSVITFSSTDGSGGSVVAAAVARNLGWRLINGLIPAEVASSLYISLDSSRAKDEASESKVGRMFARLSLQLPSEGAANLPPEAFMDDAAFRNESEA